MRVFHIFNIVKIYSFIFLSTTTLSKCAYGSKNWSPLMQFFQFHPHRRTLLVLILRTIRPPYVLKISIISTDKSMEFWRNPILSTSSDMTSIGFHACFRWVIRFGFICTNIGSRVPMPRFIHFEMGHTPSPMQSVIMPSN